MMTLSKLVAKLDSSLIQRLGVRYTMLTRDWMIHERLLYLIDWVNRLPGQLRILDVGCGSGLALLYLHAHCPQKIAYYAGIDLNTKRLQVRYKFVPLHYCFDDVDLDSNWNLGCFDVVFCSEVIEHIADDHRLLARLCSHLNASGMLLLTTPNKMFVRRMAKEFPGFDRISFTQDGGHVRIGYEPDELSGLLEGFGFAPCDCSWLCKMVRSELAVRERKRAGGDYVNMARFNYAWLLRRSRSRIRTSCVSEDCWTLAMAFRKSKH